jgi:hypothetical protein
MAVDPNFTGVNGTGRLWGTTKAHGYLTFTDDDGVTGTVTVANPATDVPAPGVVDLIFITDSSSNKWLFLVTGTGTATPSNGEVWRSPAPDANGSGISFTCVWRANGLALGPGSGAASAPAGSTLRNSSLAIDPSGQAFVLTYGGPAATNQFTTLADGIMQAGSNRLCSPGTPFTASHIGLTITVAGAGAAGGTYTGIIQSVDPACANIAVMSAPAQTAVTAAAVTFPSVALSSAVVAGGPCVYHSSNIFTATAGSVIWTKRKTFPFAKHGHAVKIISGLPWVSLGDMGGVTAQSYPDIGLWTATSLTSPTTWNQRTINGLRQGGGPFYDYINFFPTTWTGRPVILGESDADFGCGPLMHASQTATDNRAPIPLMQMPLGYTQTMRTLTLTPEGNLLWAGVTENALHGSSDCVWMSAPPFDTPYLVEDTNSTSTLSGEILCNPVVSNGYCWLGTYRIRYDKLLGQ